MLKDDIMWVKVNYLDGSEGIFRGTTSTEIIQEIVGKLPERDIYNDDVSCLRDGYVFNVKTQTVVELGDLDFSTYENKPRFNREVDEFANSFL